MKIKGRIKASRRAWQLNYAKKESKRIIYRVYRREDLPHLKRKYKKLKKVLDIDNKESNRTLI